LREPLVHEGADRPIISAVIPAFNEENTVGEVVSKALRHVDEVIVADDGSTDKTAVIAKASGAEVTRTEANKGAISALARGLRFAHGDILVTLDADGQHDPDEIPKLIEPILDNRADLVLGRRPKIPYFSERVIAALTRFRVDIHDACTGYRAIAKKIVDCMYLHGSCTCGTFVLEAHSLGARVVEVPITIDERIYGERRVKTRHIKQVLYVLYDLLRY
jgi:glycosyltransferase involved in cell wall biosynthesis